MAGWGIGHNLEKNLQRVQSFREKGQLDRALKQLQEWARKYPDTPHYLYEAAMVAFDLQDWTAGINALRSLLRTLPDTRDKVLAACRERYAEAPAVPLAEFLVEADLGTGEFAAAFELVGALPESDLAIYRRKASMRHQSLVATGGTPDAALQSSHALQFVLACVADDAAAAIEAVRALLELDAAERDRIETVLDLASERHGSEGGWAFARALVRRAQGKTGEAATLATRAARRERQLIEPARALLGTQAPGDGQRGEWARAAGELALLAGDGAAAAVHFTEAADAAPQQRDELVARIGDAVRDEDLAGRADLMKLHLRLLVVQKRFDDIPARAQELLGQGLAQAQELRSLLGEGKSAALPSDMLAVLAETALRDGDIAAAAMHANEIPTHDEPSLQRLLRAVEALRDEWPVSTRLQLDALRTVLQARVKNRDAANACLAAMWQEHAHETGTLLAVTEKVLKTVEPLPSLLRAALGPALDAGETDAMGTMLTRMLPRENAPEDDHAQGSVFDQEALSLDFGSPEVDEEADTEITEALLGVLEDDPERGRALLDFLESIDRAYGIAHRHRHAVAMAALHAGEHARALAEIAVLLMMAERELIERVGEQLDVALERQGEICELLIARADLHADLDHVEDASRCLSRALDADPHRANELTEKFERLLARVEREEAAMLWHAFGEALFRAGRFEELADVCRRAIDELPSDRVGPFLDLQARMLVEEGRLSEALQLIQQHVVAGRLEPLLAVKLLERVLRAQPSSAIAHIMLGQASLRAALPDRAIEAYCSAVRIDRSLAAPVSEQLQKIVDRPESTGAQVMRVAAFFREIGDVARGAAGMEKALRLDSTLADRVLGELGDEVDAAEIPIELLQVAARAARHAGRIDRACELLLRLDQRDPARFELVLGELRHLREDHPDQLLPAMCIARVLLGHDAPEAAKQTVVEASEHDDYALDERIEMLMEFHRRDPGDAAIGLSLGARLGEQGAYDAAVERIRAALDLPGFDNEKAVVDVRALVDLASEHPQLRLLLHDLLVRAGRVEEGLCVLPDPTALGEWQQTEISERMEAHLDRVQTSASLSLVLARSLRWQGRTEDAIAVLERASQRLQARPEHPLWTELARLLHEAGRTAESQRILLAHATDARSRREAYRQYGQWTSERLESEVRALQERHGARPQATHIALQLAEKLLEADRPDEVPAVLTAEASSPEWKVRRALLLARAYLRSERADRARALLLAVADESVDDALTNEWNYRLAECELRLGRPAAATAHADRLLDDQQLGDRATSMSRRSYQNYLEDVSGEYRAVLTRMSSL